MRVINGVVLKLTQINFYNIFKVRIKKGEGPIVPRVLGHVCYVVVF